MAALLVTYDLNSPGQRHADLLEFLKKTFAWAKLDIPPILSSRLNELYSHN